MLPLLPTCWTNLTKYYYDLSLNRYKEIEIEEVEHRSPAEILDELDALEVEIQDGLKRLREMLA